MAIYTHLDQQEIRQLAGDYGLAVSRFEPFAAGSANSNYLIETSSRRYVLSVFDEKPYREVVDLGRLLQYLEKFAYPTTRLLLSRNGKIATMHRDKPVMVRSHIEGTIVDELDTSMLHEVGAAIARLHQIPAPEFISEGQAYGLRRYRTIRDGYGGTPYGKWLTKRLPDIQLKLPKGLPRGLIHGDVFTDNVIVERASVRAIIDFEDAHIAAYAFDLGMGIVGVCTGKPDVTLKKARALVAGYQRIRQLEENERNALQIFVTYAAMTVSIWRFWKFNIESPSDEMADRHLEMATIADAIDRIPNAKFLRLVFG